MSFSVSEFQQSHFQRGNMLQGNDSIKVTSQRDCLVHEGPGYGIQEDISSSSTPPAVLTAYTDLERTSTIRRVTFNPSAFTSERDLNDLSDLSVRVDDTSSGNRYSFYVLARGRNPQVYRIHDDQSTILATVGSKITYVDDLSNATCPTLTVLSGRKIINCTTLVSSAASPGSVYSISTKAGSSETHFTFERV